MHGVCAPEIFGYDIPLFLTQRIEMFAGDFLGATNCSGGVSPFTFLIMQRAISTVSVIIM